MQEEKSKVYIFIDEEKEPVVSFSAPVKFELDTRKLVDGKHILRIVSKDITGKEGVRTVPFEVRNGPAIDIEGIKENAVIDGVIPLMINAYSKGDQRMFLIEGSETPKSIPSWVWILLIGFTGWALYYLISYFSLKS